VSEYLAVYGGTSRQISAKTRSWEKAEERERERERRERERNRDSFDPTINSANSSKPKYMDLTRKAENRHRSRRVMKEIALWSTFGANSKHQGGKDGENRLGQADRETD